MTRHHTIRNISRRTVSGAIFWATKKLAACEHPQLEAEVLLSTLLGKDRAWLRMHGSDELGEWNFFKFIWWVRRRSRHVPVAQIIGAIEWAGVRIFVDRHVLIPRDETEQLIEHIRQRERDVRTILDVGTGSGCIAVACAQIFPEAMVSGIDWSERALCVARKNFQHHWVRGELVRSDLLERVADGAQVDLIVANLPYVPSGCPVTAEVDREPADAIFSGTDGLDHLRRFAGQLRSKKIQFGALWLEFLPQQADAISQIFNAWHVELVPDIAGQIYFARITR